MHTRAILIFADNLGADLARRGLPRATEQLLLPENTIARFPGADVHLFTSGAAAAVKLRVHAQSGASFGDRLENALETLAAQGYQEIVAIGRDCPELSAADVSLAFEQLATSRLVLGPDHRGGCYLIGLRTEDRALLRGVSWKRNTDCAELRARCGESAVFLLSVKHDIDSWADLRILARGSDWIAEIASSLLRSVLVARKDARCFVDLARHSVRVRGQMPPPAFVG